jgi:hypothetical protein
MWVVQLACFVFFGYARALRGEEIPKIELTGVIKYVADGAATTPPPCECVMIMDSSQKRGVSVCSDGDGIRIETETKDGAPA